MISLTSVVLQSFDFSFEEEDSIDGMKSLIVQEVNTFRASVRGGTASKAEPKRQETYCFYFIFVIPAIAKLTSYYTIQSSHPNQGRTYEFTRGGERSSSRCD
jgi:hypothetical protein